MSQEIEASVDGAIETNNQAIDNSPAESSLQPAQDAVNAGVEQYGGYVGSPNTASAPTTGAFDTIVVDTTPVSAGPVTDVIIAIGLMAGVVAQTVTAPNAVPAGMMPSPTSLANKIAQAITYGFALAAAVSICLDAAAHGTFDGLDFSGGGSAGDRER